MGIWLFILSEVMLFGGFLSSYATIRWGSADCALGAPAWPSAGYLGGLFLAAANTLILITSSYTMARACGLARAGDARARRNLAATLFLGVLFLVIKGVEYTLKIHHGLIPKGAAVAANPGLTIVVSFYFALTGLHALHIVVGLLWNYFLWDVGKESVSNSWADKVENAGLYWHFVDVVWVFLFPLFYLI